MPRAGGLPDDVHMARRALELLSEFDAASIVKAMAPVREQLAAHVDTLSLEDLNKTLKTAMGERAVKQVLWGIVSEANNNRGQILLNLRLQNPDR